LIRYVIHRQTMYSIPEGCVLPAARQHLYVHWVWNQKR